MIRFHAFNWNAVEGNDQLLGNRGVAFVHVRAGLTALHCRVIVYEQIFTFKGYAMDDHSSIEFSYCTLLAGAVRCLGFPRHRADYQSAKHHQKERYTFHDNLLSATVR